MNKKNKYILVFLGILVPVVLLTLFLGPQVQFVVPQSVAGVPEDLEELDLYIKASEARVGDIRPGTEKKIFWAHPDRPQKTPISLVYLHGYTATRQEISPVLELAAGQIGANLFMTRLAGHGRTPEAHATVTTADWIADSLEALKVGKAIGEKVILVGTSTGGTLASWLSLTQPQGTIDGIVLVSLNYGPINTQSEMLLWPWGSVLVKLVVGEYRYLTPQDKDHEYFWDMKHRSESLLPMMALVRHVREMDHSGWKTPVLILYSSQDDVVNPRKTFEAFSKVNPELMKVQELPYTSGRSSHVIAGSIMNPENTNLAQQLVIEFVTKIQGKE